MSTPAVTQADIAAILANDILYDTCPYIDDYARDVLAVVTEHFELTARVSCSGFVKIRATLAQRVIDKGYASSRQHMFQQIAELGPLRLMSVPDAYEAERPHHKEIVMEHLSSVSLKKLYEQGELTYVQLLLCDPGAFLLNG
jgi:hypothetical protein